MSNILQYLLRKNIPCVYRRRAKKVPKKEMTSRTPSRITASIAGTVTDSELQAQSCFIDHRYHHR